MWEKDLSCQILSGVWAIDEERVSAGTCSSSAWHFTASHWTNCSSVSSLSPPHHSASFYYLCRLFTDGKYFFAYSWHVISFSSHPPWLLSLSLFVSRKDLLNTHDALLQWGSDSQSYAFTHSCCISDPLGPTTQCSRLSTLVEERDCCCLFSIKIFFFCLFIPFCFYLILLWAHLKVTGEYREWWNMRQEKHILKNLRNWRIQIRSCARSSTRIFWANC